MLRTFLGCVVCAGVMVAQTAPVVVPQGVMNAADYGRGIAPGAIFTISGRNLAPGLTGAPGFPLPTTLAGTSVEVVEGEKVTLAPLYMVSPEQINAVMPYEVGAQVQIRVRTAAGVSGSDALGVLPAAPRLFTVDQSGFGRAVSTDAQGVYLSRKRAARPGETVVLYGNSMGAVTPEIAAGMGASDGSGGRALHRVAATVSMKVNGAEAPVDFAGLCPYYSGLYQMNVRMPYWNVIGDLRLQLKAGETECTQELSLPVEPNGFYWVVAASKFPNGQSMRGLKGSSSAVAHVHNDVQTFTSEGFRSWTKNVDRGQFGATDFSGVSGLAITLKNGSSVVYDNNGIETGSAGSFYDNKGGAGSDSLKAGLWTYASMTKNVDSVFAGYVRLSQRTTFDQIIGYFDGNGNSELLFDPANVFNSYRMNIWSNANGMPSSANGFVGDVFSTDRAAGKFSYSRTDVPRVYQDGTVDATFRLVFALERPMTLEAGEYWFSHDLSITAEAERDLGVAGKGSRLSTGAVVARPASMMAH